jgi:hypothetical protein
MHFEELCPKECSDGLRGFLKGTLLRISSHGKSGETCIGIVGSTSWGDVGTERTGSVCWRLES